MKHNIFHLPQRNSVNHAASLACLVKQHPTGLRRRTEAGAENTCVSVQLPQFFAQDRARFDEQSGPVTMLLEEVRFCVRLAVVGAAFDVEAVASSSKQPVDERRVAVVMLAGRQTRLLRGLARHLRKYLGRVPKLVVLRPKVEFQTFVDIRPSKVDQQSASEYRYKREESVTLIW